MKDSECVVNSCWKRYHILVENSNMLRLTCPQATLTNQNKQNNAIDMQEKTENSAKRALKPRLGNDELCF